MLAGLREPVLVRFDRWGVPFLRADSLEDALRALGWLHANDRMLQMELARRSAKGELAELFGQRALAHDRRQRQLGFPQLARRLARDLSPESRRHLAAYAEGINAWLASRGSALPPGFLLLRHRPAPWQVEDSVALILLMARQLSPIAGPDEEEFFELLRGLGPEIALGLAGAPAATIDAAVVELARRLGPEGQKLDTRPEGAGLGSNNWAVAPSRSATGSALLANDPHLGLELPNVWYQVGIRTPDYEATGMSLPGMPGIVLGRATDVAWAMTNLYVDDVDVFFEELDPAGTRVRRGDEWLPIEVVREEIPVRGSQPVEVLVRWSDRGVLVPEDEKRGLPARSIAWTAHYGGDQFRALLALSRCRSVEEVPQAVAPWGFPPQNLIVADRAGRLLWTPIGEAPDRLGWDGLAPVPGASPSYAWRGRLPAAVNPVLLDPPAGWLATANSFLPVEPPAWFRGDVDTPYRADRIGEVLASRSDWTLEELVRLQGDVVSLWARQWVEWLAAEPPFGGSAERARLALAGWDGSMALRGPSALFALFERALQKHAFEDEARAAGLPRFGSRWRLLRLVEGVAPAVLWDDRTTPDRVEDRRAILERALAEAWEEGSRRFGPRTEHWNYGELHAMLLEHPLGKLPFLGRFVNRGPFELPGSATTIFALGGPWQGDRMDVTYGPSMRFVTEAANPERTLAGLPGGQSGHPFDRHYADQLEPFLAGELHSVPWSEETIERAAVSRLRLQPAGTPP